MSTRGLPVMAAMPRPGRIVRDPAVVAAVALRERLMSEYEAAIAAGLETYRIGAALFDAKAAEDVARAAARRAP